MKSFLKSKRLILLILSTAIMFIAISTNASNLPSTVSDAEHKQTIQQYIDRIKTLQNQVFFLNEYTLEDSPIPSNSITLINNEIEKLRREISSYIETIPSISSQNRDIALVFNALTFLKSSLYQLSLLNDTTNAVEKNVLLEDFYLLSRLSTDTLDVLETLMARE